MPQNTKTALLKWLRYSRVAPKLDYLVSVVKLAAELGVSPSTIFQIPGIQKLVIGPRSYLNEDNAEYAKKYVAEGSHRYGGGKGPSTLVPPSGPIKMQAKGKRRKVGKNLLKV